MGIGNTCSTSIGLNKLNRTGSGRTPMTAVTDVPCREGTVVHSPMIMVEDQSPPNSSSVSRSAVSTRVVSAFEVWPPGKDISLV